MSISAIFAVDFNGGMGFQGTLPWPHNSEDLANFQRLTMGNVVVMGRKTWDDPKMPKPLPGRTVYVATHRPVAYAMPFSGDIKERLLALEEKHAGQDIFVIGGVEVLETARSVLDRIYITHIKGAYRSDTRMYVKEFLAGFTPVRAHVSQDCQSTLVVYDNIFKRRSSTE